MVTTTPPEIPDKLITSEEPQKTVCPGCGHAVGTQHDKGCYYRGTVEDKIAI